MMFVVLKLWIVVFSPKCEENRSFWLLFESSVPNVYIQMLPHIFFEKNGVGTKFSNIGPLTQYTLDTWIVIDTKTLRALWFID